MNDMVILEYRNRRIILQTSIGAYKQTTGTSVTVNSQHYPPWQTQIQSTYVERQRLAAIRRLISIDPDQRLAFLKEASLQADDDELHAWLSVFADISGDLCDVGIVQSGIDLVEHEEW